MHKNIYREIIDLLQKNQALVVQTVLHGSDGSVVQDMERKVSPLSAFSSEQAGSPAGVSVLEKDTGLLIIEPVLPPERLIILGGGHIALPVCAIGSRCGFKVCVVDDRPEFANLDRFPEAQTVTCDDFSNAIRKLSITPFDYIVIVTRGHRSDADCLRAILPDGLPAYLGMIGSKRRVKGLMEMLADEGFGQEKLNRICTPIGLKIGAVTTDEIAVSILAEVIAWRRLPEFRGTRYPYIPTDLEIPVMEYLAENEEPQAIVTVIETKGSTPRAAGAKMVVDRLGNITGSIGGGCAESSAIQGALEVIGTGQYEIVDIDLTGDIAEYDGMVCGGTMKILIEDVPVSEVRNDMP